MKLRAAIYDVVIGKCDKECDTDNWRATSVIAYDVQTAMKKAPLGKGEYYASVSLGRRVSE